MPVNDEHPKFSETVEAWQTVRDCVAGSRAVKRKRTTYLPELYQQDRADYDDMLKRAVFFGATGRAHDAFVGFVFRKNPEFEQPDAMASFMRDATMTGRAFYDYSKDTVSDVLSVGRSGTLIEWDDPATGENRPFVLKYDTEDIINWKFSRVAGKTVLSLVVLHETSQEITIAEGLTEEPDVFNQDVFNQWRVIQLAADPEGGRFCHVGVYRKTIRGKGATAKTEFVLVNEYTPTRRARPLGFIPFVFHNLNGDVADPGKVPLEDFAELNLAHYRTSADLEGARHVAGQPTPYAIGFGDEEEWVLGSRSAWVTSNKDAKAGFLELSGTSLKVLTDSLEEKERQMAALGARMLEQQSSGKSAEAFETVQIRQSGESSALMNATINCSLTLSKVMRIVAWWLSTAEAPDDFEEDVYVELNTEFLESKMDGPTLSALWAVYLGKGISYPTFFDQMQKGGFISSERSMEDEITDIENSPINVPDPLVEALKKEPMGAGGGAGGGPPAKKKKAPAAT